MDARVGSLLLAVACAPTVPLDETGEPTTTTDVASTTGLDVTGSGTTDTVSVGPASAGSDDDTTAATTTTGGDASDTLGSTATSTTDTAGTTDTGEAPGGTPEACDADVPTYDPVALPLPDAAEPFGVAPMELYASPGPDLLVTDGTGSVLLYGTAYEDPTEPLVLEVPAGVPRDVTVGDFDDASGLDFVVANGADDATNAWIWLADGVGGYSMNTIDLGGSPYTLACGRFDSGDRLDLAVLVDPGRGAVHELRGEGDGTFAEGFELAVQSQPSEFATADLDGDGSADFFGTNTGQGGVLLREGLGDGYDNAGDLELTDTATGAAAADIDGDAIVDLIVVSGGDGTEGRAWVWRGLGGFAYAEPDVWTAPFPLRFVVAADIDADGYTDVIAGRDADDPPHALWVLRSRAEEEPCQFEIPLDERPNRFFAPAADETAPSLVVTTTTSVELLYP